MTINSVEFNCELDEVLNELMAQLKLNGIDYIRKLKPSGNSIQICCPYHNNGMERKPSAGIRKSDGMFHCFTCNEVHSLPEVISYCFGHTDDILGTFGMTWLLKNFATIQIEERKDVLLDFSRDISTPNNANIEKYVTEEELDSYRYTHPYWAERGIIDDSIIDLFDLGYDIVTKCITFPVRDINGNCLFVAKRSVQTKFFHYPEGVKKPLYGLYELYNWGKYSVAMNVGSIGEIIVCESMIDCILLWQEGHYTVALNGLGNDLQFKQLQNLPCRKIILATDNDDAGRGARKRIKQSVKNKLFTEIQFPEEIKDIGECSQEQIKNILNWEVF